MPARSGRARPVSRAGGLRQFGSDLDASTKKLLNRGARLTELLKQSQFAPLKVEEQVVVSMPAPMAISDALPVSKVREFEQGLLLFLRSKHADILDTIRTSKELSKDTADKLVKALDAFSKTFA